MPQIVNSYAEGNSSIGSSLASLGNDMFANQAQKELLRSEALKNQRVNANAPLAAQALRDHNGTEFLARGVEGGQSGQNYADYLRANEAVRANGNMDAPALATASMGAGGTAESTAPGQQRSLANARATTGMTVAGMLQANRERIGEEKYQFENTPTLTGDASGNPVYATNKTVIGTSPSPTSDRIKALLIKQEMDKQNAPQSTPAGQPAAAPPTKSIWDTPQAPALPAGTTAPPSAAPAPAAAPTAAPMAPTTSASPLAVNAALANPPQPAAATAAPPVQAPVAAAAAPSPAPAAQPAAPAPQTNSYPGELPNHPGIPHPVLQKALGLPPGGAVHMNPTTGQVGMSYDGGRSVQDASTGKWYVGAGNGFLPASAEAGAEQTRQNNIRAAAAAPPPAAVVQPGNNAAMADARTASGIGPFIAHHLNEELGATGVVPAVTKALGMGEEIGPAQERARSSQDVRNNEARTALLMNPGRQSTQMQKWVNELLPEDHALTNPATEAQKVPMIVKALQGDLNDARSIIQDINTPAAQRTAAVAQVAKLEHAIRLFTQPTESATAPAQAPAAPQTATNPKTGQQVQLVNGQWVPVK